MSALKRHFEEAVADSSPKRRRGDHSSESDINAYERIRLLQELSKAQSKCGWMEWKDHNVGGRREASWMWFQSCGSLYVKEELITTSHAIEFFEAMRKSSAVPWNLETDQDLLKVAVCVQLTDVMLQVSTDKREKQNELPVSQLKMHLYGAKVRSPIRSVSEIQCNGIQWLDRSLESMRHHEEGALNVRTFISRLNDLPESFHIKLYCAEVLIVVELFKFYHHSCNKKIHDVKSVVEGDIITMILALAEQMVPEMTKVQAKRCLTVIDSKVAEMLHSDDYDVAVQFELMQALISVKTESKNVEEVIVIDSV